MTPLGDALRLVVILDPEAAGGRDLAALGAAAVAGGATMLQVRAKRAGARELAALVRAVCARAGGVPVLVDPGFGSYDPTDPFMPWDRGATAHNVAVPTSDPPVRRVSSLSSLARSGRVDRFVVQNKSWTRPVTVTGVVDDSRRSLTLTSRVAARFTTHLHLAPGWRLWSHRGLTWTFVTATRVLRITPTTTPSAQRVLRGSTSPIGGWVFTAFRTRVAAPELLLSSRTGSQSVTLVVTAR